MPKCARSPKMEPKLEPGSVGSACGAGWLPRAGTFLRRRAVIERYFLGEGWAESALPCGHPLPAEPAHGVRWTSVQRGHVTEKHSQPKACLTGFLGGAPWGLWAAQAAPLGAMNARTHPAVPAAGALAHSKCSMIATFLLLLALAVSAGALNGLSGQGALAGVSSRPGMEDCPF